jgi:hypothetical protein
MAAAIARDDLKQSAAIAARLIGLIATALVIAGQRSVALLDRRLCAIKAIEAWRGRIAQLVEQLTLKKRGANILAPHSSSYFP